MIKNSRVIRLLKLAGMLRTSGCNIDELASIFDVSRRTIFRDLKTLREADIAVDYEEELQQVRIQNGQLSSATSFTTDEALAFVVLCRELGGVKQAPLISSARSAGMKLENMLPETVREAIGSVANAIQIRLPAREISDHEQSHTYRSLVEAIATRVPVRLRYDSPHDGDVISTKLSPYRLLFSRHSWYVVGRSSLHRSVRTFKLLRILDTKLLEGTYKIPSNFSIDKHLRNAWHLIPEPGPDHEVVVRFSAGLSRTVPEVKWHKTQSIKFNQDGSFDFRVQVSGLNEISWWILGYGDGAEVLKPDRLRTMVIEKVKRMAECYGV